MSSTPPKSGKSIDDRMRTLLAGEGRPKVVVWATAFIDTMRRVPASVVHGIILFVFLRLTIAGIFWRSARAKVDGWNIFDVNFGTRYLFTTDFGLPGFTAVLASVGEHLLAIALVIGLGTRFAAVGLLMMTLVIQIVVPGGWPTHLGWAFMLGLIMLAGPGMFSLDRLIVKRWINWEGR